MKVHAAQMAVLTIALAAPGGMWADPLRADSVPAVEARTPTAGEGDHAQELREQFNAVLQSHAIPGAQLAYTHQGTSQTFSYGVMNNATGARVSDATVFQAASLSKVLAAYVALRLVDQGQFDLDRPLWEYWHSNRTRDSASARRITARMVLNHTSGLVNWQVSPSNPVIDSTPLTTIFEPGARFSYSGEGFYLLQRTLEHVTGLAWNELAQREVFSRFDMPSSSYLTRKEFDARNATGHDGDGTPQKPRVFAWENTAWTLVSNAHDYNNFIQRALFKGEGLAAATHAAMLAPSSDANDAAVVSPADPYIDWGLGVGIQSTTDRRLIWHWGDNPGFKALFVLDPISGDSLVLFTNSERGLSTYRELLETFMGKAEYPAVDWAQSQS
ncbi:CubicO group peptidase, beta-lactamase class C family [Pseudoxanthomonas indica]|uniref:CubicO group peptidase, beta-lactamase class C family n=2 Tax=Pseudoxanthomonas indica TaxID=428993 RepID=A0A1T5KCH7_9GAMM|nr:CubicO group peptidase, beta-lactamase class C family [Pseudoxanthomonas indica]